MLSVNSERRLNMTTIMLVATTICVNTTVIATMIATITMIMTMTTTKTLIATMTKNTTSITSVTTIFKQVQKGNFYCMLRMIKRF